MTSDTGIVGEKASVRYDQDNSFIVIIVLMFHTLAPSDAIASLTSHEEQGLTKVEALQRLTTYGYNTLPEAKKKHWFLLLIRHFNDFLLLILVVSATISFFIGDVKDGVVILLIVVANGLMGYFQESKADNAIAALKKMTVAQAKVVRDGQMQVVATGELVPGDVIVLETGDSVPADARLLEAVQLKLSESALTGESKPIEKNIVALENAALSVGDRLNMVYKDTVVLYGRGRALVTSTGVATEMGKISQLLQQEERKVTALNAELNRLGKRLTIAAAVAAVLIFIIIVWLDRSQVQQAFLTAISLAIAVVPEGIPTIVTTVLAISVARLARKRAIVRKLAAIEILGSATCILTDKTGTLTKNEMMVSDVHLPGRELRWQAGQFLEGKKVLLPQEEESLRWLVYCAVLCNDATQTVDHSIIGDPTEACLLTMAEGAGFEVEKIRREYVRVFELPFSSETKQMTVVVRNNQQQVFVLTKGACETVCLYLADANEAHRRPSEQLASQGIRSLVYSCKEVTNAVPDFNYPEALLTDHRYLGTIGCKDPLRPEAKDAIALATAAGVRTIMITGDHKLIAQNIGLELGIIKEESQILTGVEWERFSEAKRVASLERVNVFARVTPEQKLQIVRAAMQRGETVVVTGDGVNDAPAIKAADIGVAMGISGTDVAKGAADLVLQDDNYATIVEAIKQGRGIFNNFRKFLAYQIACNASGVLIIFPLTLLTGTTPLLPVHLLLLNLISETGPCIALGLEKPERQIMQAQPRKREERLLTRSRWIRMSAEAIMLAAVGIAAYVIALRLNPSMAASAVVTTAFLSRLWHALSARSETLSVFSRSLQTNRGIYYAVVGTLVFLAASLYTNLGNSLTKTVALDTRLLLISVALSALPFVGMELYKVSQRYHSQTSQKVCSDDLSK